MGSKTVAGVDGRMWSVRRNVEWSLPATGDDFEHDVDGGRGAAVLILSALFFFWLVVIVWAPAQVHVPAGVTLKTVNMAMELEGLSFALTNRE